MKNQYIIRTDFSDELYSAPHNYITNFNEEELKAINDFLDITDLDYYVKIEPIEHTEYYERRWSSDYEKASNTLFYFVIGNMLERLWRW